MNAVPAESAVPVAAYSAVFCGGSGSGALSRSLQNGQSALGSRSLIELPFDCPVGMVPGELPPLRESLQNFNCRNARLALAALNQPDDGVRSAVEAAAGRWGAERVGVVIGTSTSGLYESEEAYRLLVSEGHMPDDFNFLTRHAYQATARYLQLELGLRGPCYAVSTACSSGAKAIAAAQRLILNGVCDAVLTGGVDTLCGLTLRGFHSLGLIAESVCRPMDAQRNGINIGEAAGLLLLQKPGSAGDAAPCIVSVGESSDAHHMSSPHPGGEGAILAMRSALQGARLQPAAIDYLNLHATATPVNDLVEARAVFSVFGDRVPVSGTKGITGHTLGAAGAIEAIIGLLVLRHQIIPGTAGLQTLEPECHCQVVRQTRTGVRLRTVMSNSFGFGGNNASLIAAMAE